MSKSVFLREAITERLTAAADEIFGTVEKIVAEYQEEISRSKEENERLRRLLDIAIKPVIKLHRTADPQLITSTLCEEKALTEEQNCDQEWNPSVENLEPPQIKEEQYLCTSQQQPQELKSDLKESTFSSTCMKRDDQNSHHSHLHQTLTEEKRVRDPLPINTAGDIKMGPHGDPQPFTHPMCEEESLPEEEWSPGLEQENLEPPRIKEEHDLWTSQEQPHMLRFIMKDSISSSPCASDQHPHLHQSQTDENRERDPLPTNTAGDIQMYPDGGDNGESELSTGCSFWNKHVPTYQCKYCSKSYISKDELNLHERRHIVKKPYQCKYCSKCYISKDELNRHERLHTVKKPYQCKYCGRWYIRKSALNRHERIHTGNDQHDCKVCGKRFSYTGDLNRHELVHTGIKPYGCTFCSKCFSQKSNLKRHELVHKSQNS